MNALLSIFFILFPFLIYFGLNYFGAIFFASLIFVLLVIRVSLTPSKRWLKVIVLSLISIYCLAIGFTGGDQVLRYYPVLMTLYVTMIFSLSLLDEESIIEKFAKLSGKSYPQGARVYMRALTKIWIVLLLVNACIAIYSACCRSIDFWVFYNGFLSYIVMIGFFILEWIFRQWYRRKYFPESD